MTVIRREAEVEARPRTNPEGRPPTNPSAPRLAKRGFSRSGSAVCGVLGFQQHLGLWPALFGGVGWLVASDHGGYLIQRRYGARMRARLSRWQPAGLAGRGLIASLHMLIGDRSRDGATSYPRFALINIVGAVLWGSVFVGAGYLLASNWYAGQMDWPSLTLILAPAGILVSVSLTARRRRGGAERPPRRGNGV